MAFIEDAGGDDSIFRRVQRLNPPVLEAHLALYQAVVEAPSPLSVAERRAIGVVVSAANRAGY